MVTEQDLADVIAGHFQTSRTHAYELMEKALLERGYAHGKTDTQTAVAAERERCARAARAAIFSIPADIRMSADILIHATDVAIGWPNAPITKPNHPNRAAKSSPRNDA